MRNLLSTPVAAAVLEVVEIKKILLKVWPIEAQ
jgi:hypothetical protein